MKIRIARAEDVDWIKQIYRESRDGLGGNTFNIYNSWKDFLQRKTPYKFWVIEGKAFMRYGYSKMLKCYTIKEIAVGQEHRGKGYAEALFKTTKSPLYLTSYETNESANRFYEKMGMQRKGQKLTRNHKKPMTIWLK